MSTIRLCGAGLACTILLVLACTTVAPTTHPPEQPATPPAPAPATPAPPDIAPEPTDSPEPPPPAGAIQQADVLEIADCQIKLPAPIVFRNNSDDLDPRSFPHLDDVRDTLAASPHLTVWIDGHTDSKGSNKFNKLLTQLRTKNIKQYLVEAGIHPARLEPRGMGEEVPLADNSTAEGRAINRRVEFNLKDCVKPTAG